MPVALNQFEQLKPSHTTSLLPPSASNLLSATPSFSLTRLTNAAFGRPGRSPSRTRDSDRDRSRSGSRDSRTPVSAPGSFVSKNETEDNANGLTPLIKAGSSLESLVRSSTESLAEPDVEEMLTPAQKMELERENQTMLKELEDNLEQVWWAFSECWADCLVFHS